MYDNKIDKKWENAWYASDIFCAKEDYTKPKFFGLVEFPYPSGVGLHIGHVKAYIGLDVISRKKRLDGFNVLFPIGWDAFGLPTENYAIKTGIHPRIVTEQNIAKFTEQLKSVGFSFDFSHQVNTTEPSYYKWTQWIFIKLLEKGLAYKDKTEVNFCNNCKVILSKEESQGGKCDRCGGEVVQMEKEVWMLKITDYAEKLLEGLNEVDFPERVRVQQENWIGKSTGAEINFKLDNVDDSLKVYTTRPDTIYGVTFMVIAPEHPIIEKYRSKISNIDEVLEYGINAKKKTEFERVQLAKDKTGVKLEGISCINPITGKNIPIWVADYVMMGYGTGAIMAVPAHDTRDFDFAKKYNLDIVQVIAPNKDANVESNLDIDVTKKPYTDISNGIMVNSGILNGMKVKEAISKMIEHVENEKIGLRKVNYFMKDWAFARQRYWGEPVPVVKCEKCGIVPLDEKDLPLTLPDIKEFKPGQNGESPLVDATDWVNTTCPKCGKNAKRETDTMPQWAGSSWYYLRYVDPNNTSVLADSEKLKYWLPVDWYNGGMEHVTRHLIYSRFWHRFLYDIGVVPTREPYAKRTTQGLVLGSDGEKMSKSKGNVIDPQDIVNEYGADTLRMYILFMGEYDESAPWNENGVKGVKKFLDRVIRMQDMITNDKAHVEVEKELHMLIKKVTSDIESMKFNTSVAAFMSFVNLVYKEKSITHDQFKEFLIILSPFAPHVSQELYSTLFVDNFIEKTATWPVADENKLQKAMVEIAVQINGSVKFKMMQDTSWSKDTISDMVLKDERLSQYINEKNIAKVIVVPGRIVNIVVK